MHFYKNVCEHIRPGFIAQTQRQAYRRLLFEEGFLWDDDCNGLYHRLGDDMHLSVFGCDDHYHFAIVTPRLHYVEDEAYPDAT